MTSDNGNDKVPPEEKPMVVAQIGVDSAGQLVLMVSGMIVEPVQFGLSAIQLLAQFVREQHAKAEKATIAIARPTLAIPQIKGRRP